MRLRQKQIPEALDAIRQAVRARSDDWSLSLMEGVILFTAGKPADALVVLGDKPASPAAIEARGDALAVLGKQVEARTAYTRALAQMDVAAPQRRLVELKLTEVGGSPARTEGSTP